MQSDCCEDRDKHLEMLIMDNFIPRLVSSPKKISGFICKGDVVADIGCGQVTSLYPSRNSSGGGNVYAVGSDRMSINALEAKSAARSLQNLIQAYAASAAEMKIHPRRDSRFSLCKRPSLLPDRP